MKEQASNHLLITATRAYPPSGTPVMRQETSSGVKEYTTALIGWILQGGVILSASIILIGFLLLLLYPGGFSAQRLYSFPHTLAQMWMGLLTLRPQAVIVLGLLLLMVTPVMRVAVSVVAFAMEHDRRYVGITLIVLAILLASFLIGKGGA